MQARPARSDALFLPLVGRAAPAEPCQAPTGGAGWQAVCGGFGRIRDLNAVDDGSVWAVGDGAARLVGGAWRAELGADLFGLEAMALSGADGGGGWAVGGNDTVAELVDGSWRRYRPDEGSPAVDLAAVALDVESWAGGAEAGHAALRVLARGADGSAEWIDVPDQASALPPIDDIFTAAPLGRPGGWAVGSTGSNSGAFLRLEGSWRLAQATIGRPQELAMLGLDRGWAFGPYQEDEEAGVAFWRISPDLGETWIEERDLRMAGRKLLDAYKAPDRPETGPYTIYVGLEPEAVSQPVVLGYRDDLAAWVPVAAWPSEDTAAPAAELNRAIAPTADGDLIYAWGERAWRIGAKDGGWETIQQRRRLSAVVADEREAWALDADTGDLLDAGSEGVRTVARAAPGTLLAGAPGDAWLFEPSGGVARVRGPLGRIQTAPPITGAHTVSAVTAERSGPMAAGVTDSGELAVWVLGDGGWTTLATIESTGLEATGLASGASGWAWLTASSTGRNVNASPPGRTAGLDDEGRTGVSRAGVTQLRDTCAGRFRGRVIALPPECRDGPCEPALWCFEPGMVAVATSGEDRAWSGGAHALVRCRGGICSQEAGSPVPFGFRVAALAAGADDDVWAGLAAGDELRGRTRLLHYDGTRWSEQCRADVAIDALSVADGGMRSLWTAGSWETLIRHLYAPGASSSCAGAEPTP